MRAWGLKRSSQQRQASCGAVHCRDEVKREQAALRAQAYRQRRRLST